MRCACCIPAGGQSPRPAPDPPPAGASRPPGRALAFRDAWTCRSAGHRRAGAGETRCVFLCPPGGAKAVSPLQWQGLSPLPRRNVACRQPGAKAPGQRPTRPRRPLCPCRVRRWLLLFPDLPVCGAPSRTGGETRCVSCARPEGRSRAFPDAWPFWQGTSPLPQRHVASLPAAGPQPAPAPPPRGRWPLFLPVPPVKSAPARPDPPDQAQGRVFVMVRRR